MVTLTIAIPIEVYSRLVDEWRKSYSNALQYGFKVFEWDDWLIERLKDIYNGPQKWRADAILEHGD